MKVKYRIVVEVESDTEWEDTPDKWNMSEVMDAPASLVSYEILDEESEKETLTSPKNLIE